MIKEKPPLVVIAGPTASGKSDLAAALGASQGGVVINADSAQIYRDLSVVAATPSTEEMGDVPHRLYGARDGADACSAADWAAIAKREIERAHDAEMLPILVGGTGLYIRTLLDGIAPVPDIDPDIRTEIRATSTPDNHAALQELDPEKAQALDAADTTRIARALEVVRSTGKPLSYWQAQKEGGIGEAVRLSPLILLPDRDWLEARFERRFRQMMDEGAVEEVEALLERNLDPALPVMRAIGVPEIAAYLRGETSREDAIAAGALATRQYAKRQYTWFRNQPPAYWPRFTRPLDEDGAMDEAMVIVTNAL
ncbi:tRNA (adenosine(37)-N6)-dimethylallyltransferase MiaA [Sphingomicrobium clamense]|uniref:tRNA dimethylallyltransferase n=1 Tax=Sphingomicrobium clamense TaxID=2851013 RepID=A0ABS6V885_9SPHN|nr:tRNA (adenosine(37)-N6)-dimethylallyltransferase MiaA [Sphingomicrobium sp. B8]MBW0145268.1 tRNA (adenosine(37)-N6)-dimethylallyltransferase MiaA [Sphingomicrobium sp. B8]